MSQFIRLSFYLLSLTLSFSINASQEIDINELKETIRYTTWRGIEPDKWATLWLIKRYISPKAYFLLIKPNSELPSNALPIGLPGSTVQRLRKSSMFRRLNQALGHNAVEIKYLDQIVDDIEVKIWEKPSHPHSIWLETMYRKLQKRYMRDQVPIDCYLLFFDKAAQLANDDNISGQHYFEQLSLKEECPGLKSLVTDSVEEIDHLNVLRELSLGKKIVFVDTREDEEYFESHLPGAKQLLLRNVNEKSVEEYRNADLVIPYCVKDFRGFEVAKAMKQLGINRVATLSPNGLKGWVQSKLPVVTTDKDSKNNAEEMLFQCATEPLTCLKKKQYE